MSAQRGNSLRGTPGMRHFDERSARRTTTSSLTNRGLVSFWSEHAALRPPKCVLRELSQEHLGKTTKNEQPGPEDRHRPPNRGPKARTEAPKGGHTDERKGKHGAARPQHKHNTSTHKHQHPHPHPHTETKRTRPGTEKGREPKKKNNDVNKGETADSRSRRRLAESCMPRSVADRIGRHVPSRTESGQPRVVADDLGLLTRSGWSRCAAAATGGFFRRR